MYIAIYCVCYCVFVLTLIAPGKLICVDRSVAWLLRGPVCIDRDGGFIPVPRPLLMSLNFACWPLKARGYFLIQSSNRNWVEGNTRESEIVFIKERVFICMHVSLTLYACRPAAWSTLFRQLMVNDERSLSTEGDRWEQRASKFSSPRCLSLFINTLLALFFFSFASLFGAIVSAACFASCVGWIKGGWRKMANLLPLHAFKPHVTVGKSIRKEREKKEVLVTSGLRFRAWYSRLIAWRSSNKKGNSVVVNMCNDRCSKICIAFEI